jgi:hypothetical protein
MVRLFPVDYAQGVKEKILSIVASELEGASVSNMRSSIDRDLNEVVHWHSAGLPLKWVY